MPTIVVPGHGDVEFPDSMSEEQILAAVRKLSPPQNIVATTPKADPMSRLASAGLGMGQGASLGFGDEAAGAIGALLEKAGAFGPSTRSLADAYYGNRNDARRLNKKAEADNPGTYGAANLAGGLASGIASGKVLPSSPSDLVKMAALMGGASGVGASEANNAWDTGVDAVKGAVVGAVGGKAGELVGRGVGAAAGYLGDKAKLLAANALKGTAGDYRSLGVDKVKDLGRWLLDKGHVAKFDTYEDIARKVDPAKLAAGKSYEAALQELDKTGASISRRAHLADPLMDLAQASEARGPGAQKVTDKYLGAAADVEDWASKHGDKMLPSEAELWKQGYGDVAYPKGRAPVEPSPSQVADQNIYRTAKEAVEKEVDRIASGSPAQAQWLTAKKDYGAAATADRILGGAEGRALARNMASPSDKGAGLLTMAVTHNPAMGLVGGVLNNQIRTRAASTSAVGADALSRFLASSPRAGQATAGAIAANASDAKPAEDSAAEWIRRYLEAKSSQQ